MKRNINQQNNCLFMSQNDKIHKPDNTIIRSMI